MITIFLALPIILYCIYNLIDIKDFGIRMESPRFSCFDAFVIVYSITWIIFQFFTNTGALALFPLFILLINPDRYHSERKYKRSLSLMNIIVLISVGLIILNDLHYHFNFWNLTFE